MLSDLAARDFATDLSQVDEAQGGDAMRQAGDAWAIDSTCLKNSVKAFASPIST
jgi:hypothetical protein